MAILALCCSAPVMAAAGEPAAPAAQAANPGSERVCRVLKVTGSRLGARRVCLTRDEWRQRRQQQRQDVELTQSRSRAGNTETGL